jgi:hypothetical protein
LENLPEIKGEFEVKKVKVKEKPIKKALLRLIKKAEYNPKFLEETYDLKEAKRNIYLRNNGFL